MSTDKRDRQRANRAQRIATAEEDVRRRKRRSRAITYGLVAAAVVGGILLIAVVARDDGADDGADLGAAGEPTSAADETSYPAVGEEPEPQEASGFFYGSGECPAVDRSDAPRLEFTEPQPLCIDPDQDYVAVLDTSEGEVRVDLDTDAVPGTVNNFVTLARWGYYDDTLLFRTDPSIAIIQGGSPHTNTNRDPGPGYTIRDEPTFELNDAGAPVGPYRYEPGQLVMARSSGLNSAGAQFFFTTGPEAALLDSQGVYVVFGTTDDTGLEVLRSIIDLHVPGGELGGAPSRDVTINSVTIEEA